MNRIGSGVQLISARTIGRRFKADQGIKPFKYRKIHLLNEPPGSRGRLDQSWFSNGTQTTLVWL
ncbi:Hypothetical protein FKW44_009805 [Caligus rogercresseyi]|uniref:Uncharacterized protein n=1 Tax=Caligus rogercresseyi TaxID=217165 RepID=A0A7T8K8K4_CALRO|nr:Hypothetical protein FKW44_009805 [Caligus rogercresseyi]